MRLCGSVFNNILTSLIQAGTELLSAFFVLFVTLSAFPAVASLVVTESNNETWQGECLQLQLQLIILAKWVNKDLWLCVGGTSVE